MRKTVCIDFDGVINSYESGWTAANNIPDKPVPGAIDALIGYLDYFTVCIHSSRFNHLNNLSATPSPMHAVRDWLIENGIDPESIRTYADSAIQENRINLVESKPPAIITIDDRGFTFKGEFPSVEFINSFKPWNKE